jgi:transcription elongation GreA/GreB family factor
MSNQLTKETLKKKLLEFCLQQQYERVETAEKAVEDAAEIATQEDTSAEEKYEGFRTQMQADRDMFNKQLSEARDGLNTLHKIELDREIDRVALGAVVITNAQKLFLSINIGQIKLENETFFAISLEAPIVQDMLGKHVGDSFKFRDKTFQILEVF